MALLDELGTSMPKELLLDPLATIAAMILCAIHIFAFYGKKKNTIWGVSAVLIAGAKFYYCSSLITGIEVFSSWNEENLYSELIELYTFSLVSYLIIGLIFVIIALKYLFAKNKLNIRAFPIIAIVVTILSNIIPHITWVHFDLSMLSLFFGWLYIVPFLLFIFFCSPINEPAS